MENFGKFIVVMLTIIISPIINGFVFKTLWLWFIVPTFEANPLRVVEAYGLMVLINFVKTRRDKEAAKKEFWGQFATDLSYLILTAGITLLIGWIVQMFM